MWVTLTLCSNADWVCCLKRALNGPPSFPALPLPIPTEHQYINNQQNNYRSRKINCIHLHKYHESKSVKMIQTFKVGVVAKHIFYVILFTKFILEAIYQSATDHS